MTTSLTELKPILQVVFLHFIQSFCHLSLSPSIICFPGFLSLHLIRISLLFLVSSRHTFLRLSPHNPIQHTESSYFLYEFSFYPKLCAFIVLIMSSHFNIIFISWFVVTLPYSSFVYFCWNCPCTNFSLDTFNFSLSPLFSQTIYAAHITTGHIAILW